MAEQHSSTGADIIALADYIESVCTRILPSITRTQLYVMLLADLNGDHVLIGMGVRDDHDALRALWEHRLGQAVEDVIAAEPVPYALTERAL